MLKLCIRWLMARAFGGGLTRVIGTTQDPAPLPLAGGLGVTLSGADACHKATRFCTAERWWLAGLLLEILC